MNVLFITGNQNKADYLEKLLDVPLDHHKYDLDEIQSTSLDEVVTHKVKQAYELAERPVLVEDVGLGFDALNGLPGPFVKFFVDQPDGLEKMCRMLDGLHDRAARAETIFGYYDGERLELIKGGLDGTIADHPRGEGGFGWDKIFCPVGFDSKTRAELILEQDTDSYQTIKPIAALRDFLKSVS
ncbi:non-canonical purine NTP pyrophosphatase [Streptomyces caniscabiei]|uniref:non-canonical purine NTP pyrophosphatase n=1 Tax=Streptomyces caniscabiei TaxID=2746961 RepID=UPI0029BBD965|nr:non-canonical purine NTP pyrophosphatase [Streptomyces caniscabiei]MDX2775767.1 non-canonical purine NTP pyrophosphatase [Streptomyces caniscabiei]